MKTKRLLWFFTVAALAVFSMTTLSSCFSPWSGDPGTVTISFGDAAARATAAPPADVVRSDSVRSAVTPDEVPTLTHIITLTGPGATVTERLIGAGTVSINLPAGRWYIRVRAESPEPALTLRALGFGQVQVVARHRTSATIDMISATEVANYSQLSAAINTARDDGLEKIIMIMQDIEAASQLTIGSGRNITFASETDNVVITRGAGLLPNDAIFIEQGNGTFRVDREEFEGSVYVQSPVTDWAPPVDVRGSGTADDPFRVTTEARLRMVGGGTANPDDYSDWTPEAHYLLINNINLTGVNWEPIGTFTGTFDGGGNSISDLTINTANEAQGMFSEIGADGTVRNLHLNVNITSSTGNNIGGLAGFNMGGTVQNVSVSGNVRGYGNVGGIVGNNNNGTVENSVFAGGGTVTGTSVVGGIVGNNTNNGTVRNSASHGFVTGAATVGGVVGNNNGYVQNVFATGEVSGDTAGGIVGWNSGEVRSSVALNTAIIGTGQRVAGGSGLLANNFGLVNIPFTGGIGTGADAVNGQNVFRPDDPNATASIYTSASWWQNNANFSSAVWNIADGSLPILLNMPAGTVQPTAR